MPKSHFPLCRTVAVSLLGGALLLMSPESSSAAPSSSMSSSKPVKGQWWPQSTEAVLVAAGTNRAQLTEALTQVSKAQRPGMQFLIENMPLADAKSLTGKFLLTHVALAYDGFNKAPWKKKISQEMFFNDVLPYTSLNEVRDDSYAQLAGKVRPLVAKCKTPGEAAQVLNKTVFPLVNVKYSTGRKKPDQTPLESMETGLASCSGLSILLVDACRLVGIPARVVGTPMWANERGNHTWVEIWDGDWQFLGAAEPDEKGLNHGWFTGDAAQAKEDNPRYAIYASSFKKTGTNFPMVWDQDNTDVHAVNVTSRYASKTPLEKNKTRILLKAVGPNGKRVKAPVIVLDAATKAEIFRGNTKDESFDTNDFLSVQLTHNAKFEVKVGDAPAQPFEAGNGVEKLVTLTQVSALQTPIATKESLQKELAAFFAASPEKQATWKFAPELDKGLAGDEANYRQAAWEAYKAAPIHDEAKKDFDAKQVRFKEHTSPYLVKTVGEKPAKGWGLVIAMHGGGGTAKSVNDSQWQGMFSHYKDQPDLGGYHYLSLRAPNDTWNGFYDDYVYPLIANLIKNYTVFGDVDPNKVYIMGYSHGGYGAYAIGPKEPDLFAAIHASAGAATDGETTPKTLRNTKFTAMVGEFDTAYDRLTRNQRFDKEIKELRGDRTDIYPVRVDVMAGFQHGNLKDGDMLKEMLPVTRNTVPRELTWLMTDKVITDFFWLRTNTPEKTKEIDATCRDNKVTVTTTGGPQTTVLLDGRLIDYSKPVTFEVNGKKTEKRLTPSLLTLCQTLARRGDPDLAFTSQVDFPAEPVAVANN